MIPARVISTAFAVSALAPASAGAAPTRPPASLAASPTRITFAGAGRRELRVTNPGSAPIVVDVTRAGFALDLRGRPRVVARDPQAASWIRVQPHRLVLARGASAVVAVTATPPRRVEPGDHDALVLLTTRPRLGAPVGIRIQIGVVVVVRAPGRVARRLLLQGLRVQQAGRRRTLELSVANLGNVSELLPAGRVRFTLFRRGRVVARLVSGSRELLPRTRGVVDVRYRGAVRGPVTALVQIARLGTGSRPVRRAYRLRL